MVRIIDNTGKSPEEAIVIVEAKNTREGDRAKYDYLTAEFGERGKAWQVELQQLVNRDGRFFDVMKVLLAGGKVITLYFDITDFFGKH